jgi:hypothetical protein
LENNNNEIVLVEDEEKILLNIIFQDAQIKVVETNDTKTSFNN